MRYERKRRALRRKQLPRVHEPLRIQQRFDLGHSCEFGAIGGVVHRTDALGANAVLSRERAAHHLQLSIKNMLYRLRALWRKWTSLIQDDVQITVCQVAE